MRKVRSVSRRALSFPMAILALGVIVAASAGAAGPLANDQIAPPKRPAATCAFTTPLPALPAACAAAPTVAQCTDPAWLKTPCGSDVAVIQKGYCQKALVDDFCKDRANEELVFPAANPKTSAMKPGAGSLFIPPGQTLLGKQVPYVALPTHAGGKPPPAIVGGPLPLSQHGGATPIRVMNNGMGSYASTTLPQWVGKYNNARQHVSDIHFGLARTTAVDRAHELLFQVLGPEQWVGDGKDTPQNREVSSCGEFVYQRWYDYTRFKNAAKGLGRDYRGVYALATDPKSPVNIEKPNLRQFAIGALPDTWPTKYAYHDPTTEVHRNAFFTMPMFWDMKSLTPKQTLIVDRIKKWNDYQAPNRDSRIKLPNANALPRFEVHRRLRNMLEAKYHLSDDAIDERQARQNRYTELLTSHDDLMHDLFCARVPIACCQPAPKATQGKLDALLDKIHGAAVINPDPTQFGSNGVDVGNISPYSSFRSATQLQLGEAAWSVKGMKTLNSVGARGMKQKGTPIGQQAQKAAAAARSVTPSGGSCEQTWGAKLPSLEATMNAIVVQLTDLLQKEYDIPDGCLEDAGNDLGNSCDWSYEKFSHFAMTYFDDQVETDFKTCNARTNGNFANVRDQSRQGAFIYPCEVRHDFGADQLDVQYFLDAVDDKEPRKFCDAQRAQQAVDAYLKQYASVVKRIPIQGDHIGESSGDTWTLGDSSSFGAYMKYALGWTVGGGANNPKTTDGAWCRPVGDGNMSASAGFYFFGSDAKVLDAASDEQTTEDAVYYGAHMRLLDLDTLKMSDLFPPVPDKTRANTVPVVIPQTDPHILGDIRYDFWMSVGPIPLHIFFGANASVGIDVDVVGKATNPTACATAKGKPIEEVSLDFGAGTKFDPWVRADAYADASIDVVVASAGIHLDLLLLRIGLPTGATASAADGKALVIKTGSELTVDALEGRVSAYVKFGISPLAVTAEVTLFGWDGLHSEVPLFGRDDSFPLKLATWAAQSKVDPKSIACKPYQSPNANGTPNPTFAGHGYCLKNPTLADDLNARSCAIPYAAPSAVPWCKDLYALRGPLQ